MMDQTPSPTDVSDNPEVTQDKAGKPAPEVVAFPEIMALALAELPSVAIAVRSDHFKNDGIGLLGNMFRRLSAARNTSSEEEYWAQILELASALWDHEFHDASLKLLRDADLRLSPPEIFRDHFKDSIAFGQDYVLFLKAKEQYDLGDEVAAAASIAKMHPENRVGMEAELRQQGSVRRRNRRTAFIAAGVTGGMLCVAITVGIISFSNFIKNPPTFSVKEFSVDKVLPDMGFQDANLSVDPNAIVTPIAPPVPPVAPQEMITTPEAMNTDTSSEIDASSQIFGSDLILGEEPTTEVGTSAIPPDATVIDEPAAPLDKRVNAADDETIYNCALAFRISATASRMAGISEDPLKISRADAFQRKFLSACNDVGIEISDLQEVAATIADEIVENFSKTIIAQD